MYFNKIDIYYDGINIPNNSEIKINGFTTNPTILKKYNLDKSYKQFSKIFVEKSNNLPVSFEVDSDESEKMIQEAKEISSWGGNIFVKIPIINTKGEYNTHVIQQLKQANIKQNITAIFTQEQIIHVYNLLKDSTIPNILSIFCGRIADTGIDPMILCKYSSELIKNSNLKILWASTREVFNVFQAIESGCNIITINNDIFKKLCLIGKDLNDFSKETVQMFITDGQEAKLTVL